MVYHYFLWSFGPLSCCLDQSFGSFFLFHPFDLDLLIDNAYFCWDIDSIECSLESFKVTNWSDFRAYYWTCQVDWVSTFLFVHPSFSCLLFETWKSYCCGQFRLPALLRKMTIKTTFQHLLFIRQARGHHATRHFFKSFEQLCCWTSGEVALR